MPTQTPLTDAINALTTYANTVTSASDTTLSDAVATLVAGYGGGGGSVQHKSGTFTGTGNSWVDIAFGFVPDLIYIRQNDSTTLKKRISEVFSVQGIGACGLYYSSDTATSATKASLQANPDMTSSTNTIYIWGVTTSGCNVRISSLQLASGVSYAYDAWKFM